MTTEWSRMTAKAAAYSRWMLVPPPLLFAGVFGLGMVVQRWLPLGLLPEALASLTPWLGGVCLALGVALTMSCVALFARRRTTIVPHARANSLVAVGPYRVTRNPMYLGLTLVYLGATALTNTLWPLLFLALPLWVLQTRVIPFEEQTLTAAFGDQYAAYSAQVRRWL